MHKIIILYLFLFSFSCFAQGDRVHFNDFKIGSLILLNHVDTVIVDKGAPNNIEGGKKGLNMYYNLYKYDGLTIYVDNANNLISAFEIDTPVYTTARNIKVGSNFKDLVEAHYLYPSKRNTFVRCGPYDIDYKSYSSVVIYDIVYKEPDNDDVKSKILVYYLKDDLIKRIFIYQGARC